MNSPEMHHHDRFDDLLDAEIARMKDKTIKDGPANPQPLTMEEYRAFAQERMAQPSPLQIRNFLSDFNSNLKQLFYPWVEPGDKIVPLLMPHEHGYPEFEPQRLEEFGHLYYYVLDPKDIAILPTDVACIGAILPPEIIQNGIVLPKDFRKIENFSHIPSLFEQSVLRMLEMVKG